MDTIPWYQSAIIRQQVVAALIAITGLFGWTSTIDIDATVGALLGGVGALISVWTIVTRIVKPAPNLSQAAADKEAELKADGKMPEPKATPSVRTNQGGFARVGLLALMLAFSSVAVLGVVAVSLSLPGCVGTTAAYKSAQSLSDTAYVVTEHYAAVVHEAADLAEAPTTPESVKAQLRALDAKVKPLILGDPATDTPGLRDVAARYQEVKNAKTEADLQAALNRAVEELAHLINAVKAARR